MISLPVRTRSTIRWRGLLADCTDLDALAKRLGEGPLGLYCGFDPTGDSLRRPPHGPAHAAALPARRHHPIALAGGATGMIGDPRASPPSAISHARAFAHNVASIKGQLARLLDFNAAGNPARLVDNADWTAPISYLDFLRDVGGNFSLNVMLAKDSVKSRMRGDSGISYTEFSYQPCRPTTSTTCARPYDCELQIGGSDQWGNITAGTDFIRKKLGVPAWGWTFPLITKSRRHQVRQDRGRRRGSIRERRALQSSTSSS